MYPASTRGPHSHFPPGRRAFEEQGVTLDDAFDLTPESEGRGSGGAAQATASARIFTPPSLEGTVMRPSIIGGANWGGGALDPETGMLYVKSSNSPSVVKVKAAGPEVGADYVMADGEALFQAAFR